MVVRDTCHSARYHKLISNMRRHSLLWCAAVLLLASQSALAADAAPAPGAAPAPATAPGGTWVSLPEVPVPLGEVSAGLVTNSGNESIIVLIGEGDDGTYLFNIATETWTTGAPRPEAGHHVGAEVIGNLLYLFGGLRRGQDLVQIYDIETDTWTEGAQLPYAVGSAATAYINGSVYLCGGIKVDIDDTIADCLRYDVEADEWDDNVAPMPEGVNHAASATDGELMYVAGGRKGPNRVGPGYDYFQIYDPSINEWTQGPSLPEGRGGMGKAVVYNGELFVFGGESDRRGPEEDTGLTDTNVYDRVDVYDLQAQEWRLATPMEVPRHGIFPVSDGQGSIYLPAGGIRRGNSQSVVNDVFVLN